MRIWEYAGAGEPGQGESYRHDSYWLAQFRGTAHSARHIANVAEGVQLWSVSAGEGHAHGERRLVWRDTRSGRLYCEQHGGRACCHAGAILVWEKVHGTRREEQAA